MRLRVVADFDHKIELSDVCSDECQTGFWSLQTLDSSFFCKGLPDHVGTISLN